MSPAIHHFFSLQICLLLTYSFQWIFQFVSGFSIAQNWIQVCSLQSDQLQNREKQWPFWSWHCSSFDAAYGCNFLQLHHIAGHVQLVIHQRTHISAVCYCSEISMVLPPNSWLWFFSFSKHKTPHFSLLRFILLSFVQYLLRFSWLLILLSPLFLCPWKFDNHIF